MFYADISFTTEGTVAIGAMLSALVGALVTIGKLLLASKDKELAGVILQYEARLKDVATEKDKQIEDLKEREASYKEMAQEGKQMLVDIANQRRWAAGEPPMKRKAAVVAEHHSPETEKQAATAALATLRREITDVTLDLGMPAREAGIPMAEHVAVEASKADPGDAEKARLADELVKAGEIRKAALKAEAAALVGVREGSPGPPIPSDSEKLDVIDEKVTAIKEKVVGVEDKVEKLEAKP